MKSYNGTDAPVNVTDYRNTIPIAFNKFSEKEK